MDAKELKINLKKFIRQKSDVILIYVFLFMLIVFSGILNNRFLSSENFKNLIVGATPYILVSFAQTIILLMGGIDLSIGAIVCLSNVICVKFGGDNFLSFLPGLLLSLIAGAVAGFLNGIIVAKGKLPPIIVTLASLSIFAGLSLFILHNPGGHVHKGFAKAITGDIFLGIPSPLIIIIIITIFLWIITNNTKYGRSIIAIGGSENSAFSSGIPIDRVKIITYTLSGFLSGLAGIFIALQMLSGDPLVGLNFTLISITTAVIGGTSLAGGKGGIIGTIAGVFIFLIINNILNLLGVPSFYKYIMQGLLMILALTVGSLRKR